MTNEPTHHTAWRRYQGTRKLGEGLLTDHAHASGARAALVELQHAGIASLLESATILKRWPRQNIRIIAIEIDPLGGGQWDIIEEWIIPPTNPTPRHRKATQ